MLICEISGEISCKLILVELCKKSIEGNANIGKENWWILSGMHLIDSFYTGYIRSTC
jgi:hypothetical protein